MLPCKRLLRRAIIARESLTAEQKKFTYGASTPTLVLQASSNLTQAESNVLNAAANYEKSKVNLDFTTSETLTKLGIDISDAGVWQGEALTLGEWRSSRQPTSLAGRT